jgi:phage internal scaffolding protein
MEWQPSKKFKVTKANDIGKNGPGQYVLETSKKDSRGRPIRKVVTVTGTHEPVDQAQAQLTNIENLLEPARRKGLLDAVTRYEGEMDDIPAKTFEEALNIVTQASQMFEAMPAHIRNRFSNNPKEFLEFTHDPKNADEMAKMGLLKGNDGIKADGTKSYAPTKQDINANGIPDNIPNPLAGQPDQPDTIPNPADSAPGP